MQTSLIDETGTTFGACAWERQIDAAIFFSPETGPEPVIAPELLLAFIIRECRPAAVVALDAEHPDAR